METCCIPHQLKSVVYLKLWNLLYTSYIETYCIPHILKPAVYLIHWNLLYTSYIEAYFNTSNIEIWCTPHTLKPAVYFKHWNLLYTTYIETCCIPQTVKPLYILNIKPTVHLRYCVIIMDILDQLSVKRFGSIYCETNICSSDSAKWCP